MMRQFPAKQKIDGHRLVHRHDQPKNDLIAQFRGLMPEAMLRQKRPRPAAEQLEEVQDIFRRAPFARTGFSLVDPLADKGRTRNSQYDRHRQSGGDRSAQLI